MKTIKICIIDEPIDISILTTIFSTLPDIEICNQQQDTHFSYVTHGTYVTAVLIEALRNYGIFDNVSICLYSLANTDGIMTSDELMNALRFCKQVQPDIISMSIGSLNRNCAINISDMLYDIANSAIFAAASNEYKLTYPAALPQVIGIKRNWALSGARYVQILDPPDGIELLVNLPKSNVMKLLEHKYNCSSQISNSSLVPRVCANYAKTVLSRDKGECMSKETVFKLLGAQIENPVYPAIQMEDEGPPVILLPYVVGHSDDMHQRVTALQREFELLGYSCSVISDVYQKNDFLSGHYVLDPLCPIECVMYYQSIISDSMIILLTNKTVEFYASVDYSIRNWESRSISSVCSEILNTFTVEGE